MSQDGLADVASIFINENVTNVTTHKKIRKSHLLLFKLSFTDHIKGIKQSLNASEDYKMQDYTTKIFE